MVEKFEVGKKYYCRSKKTPSICVGIDKDGRGYLARPTYGAKVNSFCDPKDWKEYIEPNKHKLEGFAVVGTDMNGNLLSIAGIYESPEEALRSSNDILWIGKRIAILDLSKYNIEFTEGEGL